MEVLWWPASQGSRYTHGECCVKLIETHNYMQSLWQAKHLLNFQILACFWIKNDRAVLLMTPLTQVLESLSVQWLPILDMCLCSVCLRGWKGQTTALRCWQWLLGYAQLFKLWVSWSAASCYVVRVLHTFRKCAHACLEASFSKPETIFHTWFLRLGWDSNW